MGSRWMLRSRSLFRKDLGVISAGRRWNSGTPPQESVAASSSTPTSETMASETPASEATTSESLANENKAADGSETQTEGTNFARTTPTTWFSLSLTAALAGTGLYYYNNLYYEKVERVKEPRTFGKASVGGPFSLVNTEEKHVTEKDYRGKFMLIYFGFTFCPDICPDELDKITEALDLLHKYDLGWVQPIMISVDPYRDTPKRVKAYLQDFHPKFDGLTGDEDQIEQVAKQYRVYFSKADVTEVGDDYLMDHSIITYLMGPDGEFCEFFGKSATPKDIAERIKGQIRRWELQENINEAMAKKAAAA